LYLVASIANEVDSEASAISKCRRDSGWARAASDLLRSLAVQERKAMNRSHIDILHLLEKSSLMLILAVTTLAPGCRDERPAKGGPSAVTACQPEECSGSAPGRTIACDDLSVVGATCVRQNDGSCGWANLTCPPSQVAFVKPDAPVGACVLSYNTALVDPGADACCAWVGGSNTCDAAVACNDRSGPGCCLIYATGATLGGMGCCLYDNGSTPRTGPGADRTTECGGLLAGP
jgi:hypothetical protein